LQAIFIPIMDMDKLNSLFVRDEEKNQDYEPTPSFWSKQYWTTRRIIFALCFIIPTIVTIIVAFVVPAYATKYFPKDNAIPDLTNSTTNLVSNMQSSPPPINYATKPQFNKREPQKSYGLPDPVRRYGFGDPVQRPGTTTTSGSTPTDAIPGDCPDINAAIATSAPPSQFAARQHVVQPVGFSASDLQKPIETNKWWGSIPIPGAQQGNLFSFPYTLWWTQSNPSGMNIMHTDESQRVYGPGSPPQYYYSPVGLISWNMGATEFDSNMQMSLDMPTQFSVNVILKPSSGIGQIKLPLVNGMAFTTGVYTNLTPYLQTVGRAITSYQKFASSSSTKYKVNFNDGTSWLIYAFPSYGGSFSFSQNGNSLVGNSKFSGYIQIAKIPTGDPTSEYTYDTYAGVYVTGMKLFGSTSGSTGTYGYKFTTAGRSSSSVLHFALPHHMDSFDATTQNTATSIYLQSTSMGKMRAYTASQWTMAETLPNDITFLPGGTSVSSFSSKAISAIRAAAQADVQQDVSSQTNLDSQYFAGKALAKYAEICLVANDLLKDSSLTATCVAKLKTAIAVFAKNQQSVPLAYETSWKGLVSTAGFADAGADFGNTYYNDHHYHYGYFIHAAAILAHIDPSWLTTSNVDYVNALVRDVANPSDSDPYFPVFRSFDWFVGHSWSKGIFASADGKDEESGSEDYNFAYAMKLWGIVTKNTAMHARGNIMLAVLKRFVSSSL
jgi:endo-1,3(4)-beta-glucanase